VQEAAAVATLVKSSRYNTGQIQPGLDPWSNIEDLTLVKSSRVSTRGQT
jgi:hypothetical protein